MKPGRFLKIAILLVIGVALYFGFLKIKSFIAEDLIIDISPTASFKNVKNWENFDLELTAWVKKPLLCRTECEYLLKQVGSGEIIDSGSMNVTSQSFTRRYTLSIKKQFEGQEIFTFELSCKNLKTALCQTQGLPRTKSAIITVNHNLSDAQKEQKSKFEENFNLSHSKMESSEQEILSSKSTIHSLAQVLPEGCAEMQYASKKIAEAENLSETTSESIRKCVQLYASYDWEGAFACSSESERLIDALVSSSQELAEYVSSLATAYNSSINSFLTLRNALSSDIPQIIAYSNSSNRTELLYKAIGFRSDALTYLQRMSSKNYSSIIQEASAGALLVKRYSELNSEFLSEIKKDILLAGAELRYNYLIALQFNYPGHEPSSLSAILLKNITLATLAESCTALSEIRSFSEVHNLNASIAISNSSGDIANIAYNYSEFAVWNAFLNISKEASLIENSSSITLYKPENAPSKFTLPENITIEDLKKVSLVRTTPDFEKALLRSCSASIILQSSPEQINYEMSELPEPNSTSINLTFKHNNITLPDTPRLCCFMGECRQCCPSNECSEKNYPIIFIHGHLSYEKSSPELTINSFSALQQKFEDFGYINAGLINMEDDIPDGEWGKNFKPVSVRASYYYITYYNLGVRAVEVRKTDSIENYAIRLKEIVDEVKRRTGSDKVIIIAHSMGGLVAREYLLLFGDESVDKLVTIGTPNYGIEGAIVQLCPIFGSEKECEDMTKNSIFLKRLNALQNTPKRARIYTISAVGCDTYGRDGDGVIVADNVVLPFAKNYRIKGKCSGILRDLHSNMLQPSLYPQTFEILHEIISDNSTGSFSTYLIER